MNTAVRWTSADLAGFPDDGKRREIIAGELYVSSQPRLNHQWTGDAFANAFRVWDPTNRLGWAVSAPGVIFNPEDDVAPDVVWVSAERLHYISSGGKLRAAPDLVIEILSPGSRNIARDRDVKRKLYSRHGVREYWIADWRGRTIEVYRRVGEQLALVVTLLASDTLTSPLLPGFAVPLADLFAGLLPAGDDAE